MDEIKIHCVWHIPGRFFALRIGDQRYNLQPDEFFQAIRFAILELLNGPKEKYLIKIKNQVVVEFNNKNAKDNAISFRAITDYLSKVYDAWKKSNFSPRKTIIGNG